MTSEVTVRQRQQIAIGRAVRWCREKQNMEQEDAARCLGISQSSMSRIETGKSAMSLPQAMTLCDALHIKLEQLSAVILFERIMEHQRQKLPV